jgi:hypothetical protein
METTIWTHPNGEKEIVIKDSDRYKELQEALHAIGLWEEDNLYKPEGCISFSQYMDSEQYKEDKERLVNRFKDELKESK